MKQPDKKYPKEQIDTASDLLELVTKYITEIINKG